MSSLNKADLLKKKSEYMIPCMYTFYNDPICFDKGEMQYVYDEEGVKYLDFLGGFSVNTHGHSNPYIINKMKEQLDKIIHSTQVFINEPIITLAENLASILPKGLNKSFFVNSGSEGNETCIMIARKYNEKEGVIYLENSLHGRTNNTLAITGVEMWRPYTDFPMKAFRAVSYYPSDNISFEEQMNISLKSVEKIIKENDNISCMIAEVIQGNGGVASPHPLYFVKLVELLHKHNILLIIDEAQTGYGRTGKMFAFMHYGFVPDILMTCKALGNGMPIASVTTTTEIASKFTIPSASTNGGNMLSCAAANAVIGYMKENKTYDNVLALEPDFSKKLNALKNSTGGKIKSIRGIGFMKGIEFENADQLEVVLEKLKENKVIAGKCGQDRNIMLLQPPLIITKDDIELFVAKLTIALK